MTEIEQALFNVAAMVFEELGFLLPTPGLDARQKDAALAYGVSIEFSGSKNGRLDVFLTADLAKALTANMLGVEDEEDPALLADALGELANVLCGNLLPKIIGPRAEFSIGAPSIIVHPAAPRTSVDEGCRVVIGVESGRAEILLCLPSS